MTTHSFYIPRVSRTYSEEQIKIIFSSVLMIGDVKRVDFVPSSNRFQRAFVHMDFFYDVETTNGLRERVFEDGKAVRVYPGLIDKRIYWILLKNNNPVPETTMNLSQIVFQMNTNFHYLENLNHRIEKIESIKKPATERPLGSLLDKMFDNPFFWVKKLNED